MSYFVTSLLIYKVLGEDRQGIFLQNGKFYHGVNNWSSNVLQRFKKMSKNNSVVENICKFSSKVLPHTFFILVFYAVAEIT